MSDVTWLGITQEKMAEQLRERFKVDERTVPELTKIFINLSPELREPFFSFWSNGSLDGNVLVKGYSIPRLVQEERLDPINAFSILDWLIREPDTAERSLSSRRSLFAPSL